MTTQLTLISVPAAPSHPDADGVDRAEDGQGVSSAGPQRPGPAVSSLGDRRTAAAAPRRSAGHTGWLDRRTIASGRRGVAAARAALADAHRRVEERHSQEEADRADRLARQARELTDRGHAA